MISYSFKFHGFMCHALLAHGGQMGWPSVLIFLIKWMECVYKYSMPSKYQFLVQKMCLIQVKKYKKKKIQQLHSVLQLEMRLILYYTNTFINKGMLIRKVTVTLVSIKTLFHLFSHNFRYIQNVLWCLILFFLKHLLNTLETPGWMLFRWEHIQIP